MNCPECGEPLPDKAFICPHCGTPLLDRIICSDDMDEDSEASAPDVDDADVDVDELDDIGMDVDEAVSSGDDADNDDTTNNLGDDGARNEVTADSLIFDRLSDLSSTSPEETVISWRTSGGPRSNESWTNDLKIDDFTIDDGGDGGEGTSFASEDLRGRAADDEITTDGITTDGNQRVNAYAADEKDVDGGMDVQPGIPSLPDDSVLSESEATVVRPATGQSDEADEYEGNSYVEEGVGTQPAADDAAPEPREDKPAEDGSSDDTRVVGGPADRETEGGDNDELDNLDDLDELDNLDDLDELDDAEDGNFDYHDDFDFEGDYVDETDGEEPDSEDDYEDDEYDEEYEREKQYFADQTAIASGGSGVAAPLPIPIMQRSEGREVPREYIEAANARREEAGAGADSEWYAPGNVSATMQAANSHDRNMHRTLVVAIVIIFIVIVSVVALWITYDQEMWGGKRVPDVLTESVDTARNALEADGFKVEILQEGTDDGVGTILSMSPDPGTRLDPGKTVRITEGVLRILPNEKGKSLDDATSELQGLGLNVTTSEQLSDETPGTVLSTDPPGGQTYRTGDTVELKIAKNYTVPEVMGRTEDSAKSIITDAGFVPNVTYEESSAKVGTVISTDPIAGSVAKSGSTVNITVAKATAKTYNATYFDLVVPSDYVDSVTIQTSTVNNGSQATPGTTPSATSGTTEVMQVYYKNELAAVIYSSSTNIGVTPSGSERLVQSINDSSGHPIKVYEMRTSTSTTTISQNVTSFLNAANVSGWVKAH